MYLSPLLISFRPPQVSQAPERVISKMPKWISLTSNSFFFDLKRWMSARWDNSAMAWDHNSPVLPAIPKSTTIAKEMAASLHPDSR